MEKNKKGLIIVASIMIVLLIVISGTYAFWTTTQVQTDVNKIDTTCLNVTLENKDSSDKGTSGIKLEKAYPVSDAVGETYPGYTFTVKNNCGREVLYDVNLESLKIGSEEFTKKAEEESEEQKTQREQNSTYLQSEYIKAVLDPAGNPGTNKLLSDYTDVEQTYLKASDGTSYERKNLLHAHELEAGGSDTYTLKLWVTDNAPMTQMDKHYQGKIVIYSWFGDSNPNPIVVKD